MKQNETVGAILILGVLLIAMGSSNVDLTIEDKFHSECLDYVDNDNDGNFDSFIDEKCHSYPYNDGSGENVTDPIDMFSKGQSGYDVYDDFFEYANFSFDQVVIITGYPGTIEDYRCDLIEIGSTKYIKTYDIAFGTNFETQMNDWYFINCFQAGNGGILSGKGM